MQFYNSRFREYRKQAHQVLGTPKFVSQFNVLQDIEVRRFLLRVLEKPQDLIRHIRTYVWLRDCCERELTIKKRGRCDYS